MPGKQKSSAQAAQSRSRSAKRAEAVAAYRREQTRQQRRSRLMLATAVVAAVVIVAAAVIAIGLNRKSGPSATTTQAGSAVTAAATGVPAKTFDAVGAGAASNPPKALTAPALASHGLPRVLYVGAEYCPYCAAERWAVTAALSRFGTFAHLGQTASSSTDVYPNTPTLSFHGATYTSKYLSFTGVETSDTRGRALDKLSAADQKTYDTYNKPPYVAGSGIPFIDLGGKYVSSGASYNPQLLHGMTHLQVAQAMADPGSEVAKAIDGSANVFTAALCKLTGGKPGAVCSSAGVQAAAGKIGS